MQNLYFDLKKLDNACRDAYGLTEEIMMENAAAALEKEIRAHGGFCGERNRVLILCGGGDNGADGYALARRIRIYYDVVVFECVPAKSGLCKLQKERAEKCGTRIFSLFDFTLEFVESAAVIVDCVFGSGFHGELPENVQIILNDASNVDAFRIACDIPSGIDSCGTVSRGTFRADVTVTMGALKLSLFQDSAKDFVGDVVCADLGVGRRLYENSSNTSLKVASLLEESDMILPKRKKCLVNKGDFGHAVVALGEKRGAAILASSAALRFGAGQVTIVGDEGTDFSFVPPEIMSSTELPEKTTAVAFGMGMGRGADAEAKIALYFDYLSAHKDVACVIDADALLSPRLPSFLSERSRKVVLTPHPKEFQVVLRSCGFGEHSVSDCVTKKNELIEEFCKKYPKCVLLVKGANPMIGYFDGRKYNLYVNPFGMPCLAKAGSGDVLSGLVVALLAQKYKTVDAAGSASLAHALASRKVECDYAMVPSDIIENVSRL